MTPKAQMSQINARSFSCPTAMVYIGADVTHLCIFVLSISDEWAKYGATVYRCGYCVASGVGSLPNV